MPLLTPVPEFVTALYPAFFSIRFIWVVTAITVFMFGFSLFWVIFMVTRIPADYFLTPVPLFHNRLPSVIRLPVFCLKNISGILLLAAGIVMLVTPGQGLLTIVTGLALVDFPGKRRFEIRLLKNRKIQDSMNRIRRKKGLPDIKLP